MSPSSPHPASVARVIVVGAGVSGLTCAFRLQEKGMDVRVLEASGSPGGLIASEWCDDFLLELGPNSCRRTPEIVALNGTLGLSDDFMPRPLRDYARYVYDQTRLREVPDGPMGLAFSPLLSMKAKLRLLREPFLNARPPEDESVADFTRRHLGPEVLRKLIAPFVSGIYAGDPEKLSMKAAFPTLAGFIEAKGSLLRGAISHFRNLARERRALQAKDGAGKPQKRQPAALCSYRNGLGQLTRALAERLGANLVLNTPVVRIDLVTTGHGRPGYRVVARNPGGDGTVFEADALVIATPADTAADLSQHIVPQGVTPLQKIGYTPVTMVHVGMTEDSLPFRPEGFGFLTVKGSDARVLGVLWSSAMFDNRAPRGQVLLTLFYGGATDPEVIQESDDSVRRIVEEDLKRAMGWDGRCTLFRLKRHPRALPAYHLGHLARVKAIENAARSAPAPLRFVGNYLRGISVADCIRRAGETASELAGVLPT